MVASALQATSDDAGGVDESWRAPGDDGAEEFARARGRLLRIATRMVGSAAEAEDVVQDVWLRWQNYDRSTVRNAQAFLTTTTTRISINVAQSARMRRERCVGGHLPEPVAVGTDPTSAIERVEELEEAIVALFESLSPVERAAYVLREAFDYPYGRIAGLLDLKEANVRQLISRGRRRFESRRRSSSVDEQQLLLATFVIAAQSGELADLEALLRAQTIEARTSRPLDTARRNVSNEPGKEAFDVVLPVQL